VWALGLVAVFVVLRLPNLVEPTWYSDEGTYADIGRALLHGAALYRQVWDNKPPGVYWLAAGVVALVGPGAPAFPIAAAVVTATIAAGVWVLGRRCGGLTTAGLASLLVIVLLSVPDFEGNLFNAEIVGAALVVVAVVVGSAPHGRRWRPCAAGALVGAAFLVKGVFVLDVAAVAAVPVWRARAEGRSWRAAGPAVAAVGAGAAGVVGLAAAWLAAHGSLGGLLDVVTTQDVSYVQLTSGPAGSVVLSPSASSRELFTLLAVIRVAVPLTAAGVAAWRRSGAGHFWGPLLAWWLGCDLAGTMVSARGFSHYALQVAAPMALTIAVVAGALWRRRGRGRIAAVLAVAAAAPALQLVLFLPGAQVAWAQGHPAPALERGSFRAGQVGRYYRLGYGRLLGTVTPTRFDAFFPTDLARQEAVVAAFRRYSRPGEPVFVWGTVHWSYALADRSPAGRYVTLNSAYLLDPGSERRLVGDLTARPPTVLVADIPLPPAVLALIGRLGYARLPGGAGGADVWLAPAATRDGGARRAPPP